MMRKLWLLALVGMLFSSSLMAEDTSDLKAEIDNLRTKVAAMESSRDGANAGVGEVKSLTSLRKKGAITIGGEIKIDAVSVRRGEGVNSADIAAGDAARTASGLASNRRTVINRVEGDSINSTRFGTVDPYAAYLNFRVEASPDVFLSIKLDLDDATDSVTGQDDLLEEAYFRWNNIRGSNWDVVFGKKRIDYGMNKYVGITPSLQDGWAWWLLGNEGNAGESLQNQHNSVGSISGYHDTLGARWGWTLPTAYYHIFQMEAIYNYKDMARFSFTVFQNNERTGGAGRITRRQHEDRSDDSLFFQSWAVKAEVTPVERLLLQASLVNYHSSSMGDQDMRGGGMWDLNFAASDARQATDNQLALSLGFDYDVQRVPVNIWGEWQHGFNWRYNNNVNTDTLSLGATWNATEAIDLSLMGEWANISGATDQALNYDDEEYAQIVVTGKYTFATGIYLMLEYAHVWYEGNFTDRADAAQRKYQFDAAADVVGVRMGWQF